MTGTARIRARENIIRLRWTSRHENKVQRELLREHINLLRAERIAERERWQPTTRFS